MDYQIRNMASKQIWGSKEIVLTAGTIEFHTDTHHLSLDQLMDKFDEMNQEHLEENQKLQRQINDLSDLLQHVIAGLSSSDIVK
jgi:hypothetical protein